MGPNTNGLSSVTTFTLPDEQLVEHMVWMRDGIMFAEPGTRSIMRLADQTMKTVARNISNAGPMAVIDDRLVVLERNNPGAGDENILKIDFDTKKITSLWPQGQGKGQGMTYIKSIPGTNLLVVNQWAANNVLVVDASKMAVVKTLNIGGAPEGLATFGSCVLVASVEDHYVALFDPTPGGPSESLASWSYASVQPLLKSVRAMEAHGNAEEIDFYLRSAIACVEECDRSTNSSMHRLHATHPSLARCFAAK